MYPPPLSPKRKLSNTALPIFASPFNAPLASSPRPLSPRRLRPHDPERGLEQLNILCGDGDDEIEEAEEEEEEEDHVHDNGYDEDEDELPEATPLLPIFSASHLGRNVNATSPLGYSVS